MTRNHVGSARAGSNPAVHAPSFFPINKQYYLFGLLAMEFSIL
jgi:hypothetical protein